MGFKLLLEETEAVNSFIVVRESEKHLSINLLLRKG